MHERYNRVVGWSCYFYDEVFALARTFDWFLTTGRDFEDNDKMMNGIREMKFTGCSGSISYIENTNDRYSIPYKIT
jgi:hypothetical protein